MRVNFSILLGVLLAVSCGIASPALAQSALERLERQIRQRAGASDHDRSNPAQPVPPPPAPAAGGQVGSPAHGSDVPRHSGRRPTGPRPRRTVLDVYRGSPADKAGLRRQDLITAVAGVRVRQMTDMADILDYFAPGQGVDFDLLREGKPAETAGDIGRASGRNGAAIGPAGGHPTAARRNGRQAPRAADRAASPAAAVGWFITHRDLRASSGSNAASTSSNAAWRSWSGNWPRPARRGGNRERRLLKIRSVGGDSSRRFSRLDATIGDWSRLLQRDTEFPCFRQRVR